MGVTDVQAAVDDLRVQVPKVTQPLRSVKVTQPVRSELVELRCVCS